jgi:hypothetical protein
VPKTSSTPCDQAVFVDHAADARVSSDTVLLKVDRFGEWFQLWVPKTYATRRYS